MFSSRFLLIEGLFSPPDRSLLPFLLVMSTSDVAYHIHCGT